MKVYIYNGEEYNTGRQVRQAIFKEERKAFGGCKTATEWAKHGVELIETKTVASEPSLDVLKGQKLAQVGAMFEQFRKSSKTYIESSLGFTANANTTAFENVTGLIAQIEYRQGQGELNPTVEFMAFDNTRHPLNLAQLKTLQVELSLHGSKAYEYKWEVKAKIRACETKEELDSIDINFSAINN